MHYFWDRRSRQQADQHTHTPRAYRAKGVRGAVREGEGGVVRLATCINLMVYKINWRLIFNKTDSYVK